jgi:hypothetical protein
MKRNMLRGRSWLAACRYALEHRNPIVELQRWTAGMVALEEYRCQLASLKRQTFRYVKGGLR